MFQGLDKIKSAAEGLVFTSERDASFLPFYLEATPSLPQSLLELTGKEVDTSITVSTLEAFFCPMLSLPPNATIQQQQTVKQFQVLQQALQEVLTDTHVYKIGRIEITVFIIGELPNGDYAGLCTEIVET